MNGTIDARAALLAIGIGFATVASAQTLTVVSVDPPPRTLTAATDSVIRVQFDRPVDPTTFVANRTFWAFGRWSGTASGSFAFSDNDRTVTLTPDHPFSAGENVMVILSNALRGADGSSLRSGGYSYQFWTRSRSVHAAFTRIGQISTRTTPTQTTRSYGGVAADLNGDRRLDLAIVNENTNDVRVFLNSGNAAAPYGAFLTPPRGVGNVPSPSETADFNHDGHVDICIANTQGSSISVLLGDGNGGFAPELRITVGSQPRGICVLDVDGDGDLDIVNTNYGSGNLSLHRNNGSGGFAAPTTFDSGFNGERACAAADMNHDGLLDVVVGCYTSQRVVVLRGNGNATFTALGSQLCGGTVWQMATGDLNGDATEDVAVVNSNQNTATTLFGDGTGQLSPLVQHNVDSFPLATDIGDLDGDGDLDWITSSYQGDWFVFRNNGAGVFQFWFEQDAPLAASCALLFDLDGDLDLDVGLIDEIADVVVLLRNDGLPTCPGDVDADGDVDLGDLTRLLSGFGTAAGAHAATGDVDGDADVDLNDLTLLLAAFGTSC